jgi:hypothetical protein
VALAVFALAGCTSSDERTSADPAARAAADISLLTERVEAVHPDPWHAVSRAEFRSAARRLQERIGTLDADERLVELMRLTALLGERDGHSGIFPLDDAHDRPLHLYPIRLYEFSDGFFVVDAIGRPDLVGARLLRIGGRPVDELARAVAPLVPADNDSSRRARTPQYLVVAEVLRGLGLEDHRLQLDRGEVMLEPVDAGAWADAFEDLSWHPMIPPGLPHGDEPWTVRSLASGRAVYAAYNVTLGDPSDLAGQIVRRGRRAERVVLDVRHNPGGDNGTYPPLLNAIARIPVPVYVLIGRTTFSAAANFITELERRRPGVVFVGEPSGGAPNQYGDPVPVRLPATGLTAHVAGVYWEKSEPDDPRLAIEPDIFVELSSADYFAGRDPVVTASLRRAPR